MRCNITPQTFISIHKVSCHSYDSVKPACQGCIYMLGYGQGWAVFRSLILTSCKIQGRPYALNFIKSLPTFIVLLTKQISGNKISGRKVCHQFFN